MFSPFSSTAFISAFISVRLRSSVVPLTSTTEPRTTLKPAAPPKIAPTAATVPRAPHRIPDPLKPSPPSPPQYPATPPTHATPDKSPSSAPDPSPRFSPAPLKIPPRPKYRPPPETPTRSSLQMPANASRPRDPRRPQSLPPQSKRESKPPSSPGGCTPAFPCPALSPPLPNPPPGRRSFRDPSPPLPQSSRVSSVAAAVPLAPAPMCETPKSAAHRPLESPSPRQILCGWSVFRAADHHYPAPAGHRGSTNRCE